MITITYFFILQSQFMQPVQAELFPVIKPLQICVRFTEELQFHLLKLSGTERKVTRCDFITERFTNLSNTERQFLSGCSLNIFKVYKDTLSCFRSQIYCIFGIFSYTLECFEHQVKLTNISKVMFATGRAWNLMLFNEFFHLFLTPCVHTLFQSNAFFCTEIFNHLICTETLMTFFTIHQRIGKASQMSGSHPGLGIHQDCTVNTHIIWVFLNEFLPPCFFDIVFQFHTKITVIPCISQSTVDFGSRIYKTSGFC